MVAINKIDALLSATEPCSKTANAALRPSKAAPGKSFSSLMIKDFKAKSGILQGNPDRVRSYLSTESRRDIPSDNEEMRVVRRPRLTGKHALSCQAGTPDSTCVVFSERLLDQNPISSVKYMQVNGKRAPESLNNDILIKKGSIRIKNVANYNPVSYTHLTLPTN